MSLNLVFVCMLKLQSFNLELSFVRCVKVNEIYNTSRIVDEEWKIKIIKMIK